MTALYTFAVIDAEPRSVPQDLAPLRVVRSAGLGAVVEAARELLDQGTYGYRERTVVGLKAARAAFG